MTGKITLIEVQKRNKSRVNVYIDKEFVFACDMELVYQYSLKVGSEVETEKMNSIAEADNFMKAKSDALRYIEKSYKTEKEILNKLSKKGYDGKVISKVLSFMKEYNFMDDNKYAQSYINDKLRSQGKNRIVYGLRQKGIKDDIIYDKIESIDSEAQEDTAFRLAEKKYNILKNRETDKRKLYQKLAQHLVSRGYSWEIIRSSLRRLLNEDIGDE